MNTNFGVLYNLYNLKSNESHIMKELIRSVSSLLKIHNNINILINLELHPDYDINNIPNILKKYVKIINFSDKYPYEIDRNNHFLGYPQQGGVMGVNEILSFIDSPFEYTLYLDCDTYVLNSLDYLINMCKNNIYMTYDNWWDIKDGVLFNTEKNNKCFNGGFLLFKNNNEMKCKFKEVIDIIYSETISDQGAMMRVFNNYNDINILDNKFYNFRPANIDIIENIDNIVICHSHGEYKVK